MRTKVLIIDGHNLAHRAQHKFNLTTTEGKASSVVYGFIYILRSLMARFPSDQVYAVFDGGRHKFRTTLLPDYKKRDSKMLPEEKQEFEDQLAFIKENLTYSGVKVVFEPGQEADDLIYRICKNVHPRDYKTIVSSDKDFIQILGAYTKIFNPFKEKIITFFNVQEEYGFAHNECVDYLCLDGDKSDKIPGVPGMGPKRIRDFLDTFGSISNYLDSEDKGSWVKYPIEEVYRINRPLISLQSFFIHTKESRVMMQVKFQDFEKLNRNLLRDYQVRLFTKEEFAKPFKNLKE